VSVYVGICRYFASFFFTLLIHLLCVDSLLKTIAAAFVVPYFSFLSHFLDKLLRQY